MGEIAAANKKNYKYLGDGSPNGSVLGDSPTDKVGFYGHTPVVSATMTATDGSDVAKVVAQITELKAWLADIGLLVA